MAARPPARTTDSGRPNGRAAGGCLAGEAWAARGALRSADAAPEGSAVDGERADGLAADSGGADGPPAEVAGAGDPGAGGAGAEGPVPGVAGSAGPGGGAGGGFSGPAGRGHAISAPPASSATATSASKAIGGRRKAISTRPARSAAATRPRTRGSRVGSGIRSTGAAVPGAGPLSRNATSPVPNTISTAVTATHSSMPVWATRARITAMAGTEAMDTAVE